MPAPGSPSPAPANTYAGLEPAFWRPTSDPNMGPDPARAPAPQARAAARQCPVTAPLRRALGSPRSRVTPGLCSLSAAAECSGGPAGGGGAERSVGLGAGPARILPSPHPCPPRGSPHL